MTIPLFSEIQFIDLNCAEYKKSSTHMRKISADSYEWSTVKKIEFPVYLCWLSPASAAVVCCFTKQQKIVNWKKLINKFRDCVQRRKKKLRIATIKNVLPLQEQFFEVFQAFASVSIQHGTFSTVENSLGEQKNMRTRMKWCKLITTGHNKLSKFGKFSLFLWARYTIIIIVIIRRLRLNET